MNDFAWKDVIFEGYLEKESLYLKTFRKRWIVLKGNCLYSFKNKYDKKPTEIIDLELVSGVIKSQDNKNKFTIISKEDSKRSFVGSSNDNVNQWIHYILNKISPANSTQNAKVIKNIQNIIPININITIFPNASNTIDSDNEKFVIWAAYIKDEEIQNIINCIEKKYCTRNVKVAKIRSYQFTPSFTGELHNWGNKSLTNYKRNKIINYGLNVETKFEREHKVNGLQITCKFMNDLQSNNPLKCPIYFKMKEKYEFNYKNLAHLNAWNHFINEYELKPKCKYFSECKAYIRLENGNNKINDLCHMKIFKHPPRNRNIKLSKNIKSLILNDHPKQSHPVYHPTYDDGVKYNWKGLEKNDCDGWLNALIEEVITNGYKYDLCVECPKNEECKHNNYSILKIVNDKMDCIYHKSIGKPLFKAHILALILYTGCECNYDLCQTQRNSDYKKWKWFDMCLYEAISKLSSRTSGLFDVYSGLNNVKLDQKLISSGYLITYVSSSWYKQIAKSFMNGNGMIIQIDQQFKNDGHVKCCDVSWISKFPDECEILFARKTGHGGSGNFKCVVLDDSNGIQTVALKKAYNKIEIPFMENGKLQYMSDFKED